MKKLTTFLGVILLLCSCGDSIESPIINVERLIVNEDPTRNYAVLTSDMPSLKVGDKVEIMLYLDGMGAELQTFQLESDEEVATLIDFKQSVVTSEGNLTDAESGRLRFADGVMYTQLNVVAVVTEVDDTNAAKLNFYLSSKAECDSAQEMLELKLNQE